MVKAFLFASVLLVLSSGQLSAQRFIGSLSHSNTRLTLWMETTFLLLEKTDNGFVVVDSTGFLPGDQWAQYHVTDDAVYMVFCPFHVSDSVLVQKYRIRNSRLKFQTALRIAREKIPCLDACGFDYDRDGSLIFHCSGYGVSIDLSSIGGSP